MDCSRWRRTLLIELKVDDIFYIYTKIKLLNDNRKQVSELLYFFIKKNTHYKFQIKDGEGT